MFLKVFSRFCFFLLFLFNLNAFAGLDLPDHPKESSYYHSIPGLKPKGNPLEGFYGGLFLGVVHSDGKNTSSASLDLPTAGDQSILINNNLNPKHAPVFGINLGYGRVLFRSYYAALEFFSDFRNVSLVGPYVFDQLDGTGFEIGYDYKVTLSTSRIEYGLQFRPGYFFTPKTLMYAVIGVIRTKFHLMSRLLYFNRTASDASDVRAFLDRTNFGIQVGLGLEYSLIPRLSLRAQYVYTGYSTMKVSGRAPVIASTQAADSVLNSTRVTPRNHSMIFSLEYHFT